MKIVITKRVVVSLAVMLLGLTAVITVEELEKRGKKPTTSAASREAIEVSVIPLAPIGYTATVEVLARVQSRYKSQLTSLVEGRVGTVKPVFTEGEIVNAGDILVSIDDSAYRAEVANARYLLSQAKIELMKEEREVAQAQRDWQRSSLDGKPDTPLVFRKPQLEAAQLNVLSAEANLKRSERLLEYATVRAPYRGVITSREIDPGETVGIGAIVGSIMSVGQYEVVAQLTEREWALLSTNPLAKAALVYVDNEENPVEARIRATSPFVEQGSQLRNVYLDVNIENSRLSGVLPGRLVKVSLPGKHLEQVWRLPESSYTRDSHIWLVDKDGRLAKEAVEFVTTDQNYLIVRIDPGFATVKPINVVKYPQARFTVGQRVVSNTPESRENTDVALQELQR